MRAFSEGWDPDPVANATIPDEVSKKRRTLRRKRDNKLTQGKDLESGGKSKHGGKKEEQTGTDLQNKRRRGDGKTRNEGWSACAGSAEE